MAPHTTSATPEQIDTLLNFLDEHRDLARGRLRSADGNAQAKRLWEELCITLNSMGGCTKTIKQWQKVWFDRTHLAKKAAADNWRASSATGGGPSPATPLSQWQLKVLSIMGDGFGGRQTTARVPAFSIIELMPSTSSQASPRHLPSFSQSQLPEDIMEYVGHHQEYHQPTQFLEPASEPSVSHETLTSTSFSQATRSRRRQSAAGISSRLLQLEEMSVAREQVRNTELAGIKTALLELCGLMREFLNN